MTVTLVDGLVLARSAFHHSMNYRSVVVIGRATPSADLDDRRAALDTLVEHIVPGRTADARPPNDKELAATLVLALPLDEASVKVRTGPPLDEDEDFDLARWAGVVPVDHGLRAAGARPGDLPPGVPVPAYAAGYRRPRQVERPPTAPRQPAGGRSRGAILPARPAPSSRTCARHPTRQAPLEARLHLGPQLVRVPGVEEVGVPAGAAARTPAPARGRRPVTG